MAIHDIYSGREAHVRRPTAAPASALPAEADVAGLLWRRALVVLVSLLVCCLAGIVFLALTPSRYRATATALTDPRFGIPAGSEGTGVPGRGSDGAAADSQLDLITSYAVLARVAATTKLADDPEFNGAQRSLLERLSHPGRLDDGIDLAALRDAIAVERPAGSNVVRIDVLARDPRRAAQIANALARADLGGAVVPADGQPAHAPQTETSAEPAGKQPAKQEPMQQAKAPPAAMPRAVVPPVGPPPEAALKGGGPDAAGKLAKAAAQLHDLETRIAAAKAKNRTAEAAELRAKQQGVASAAAALGAARAREAGAKARLDEIDRMADRGRLDPTSASLRSRTVDRLRGEQVEAERIHARLAMTLGNRHPYMIDARERLATVRALVTAELGSLRAGAEAGWQAAQAEAARLGRQVDAAKAAAGRTGGQIIPLDRLERERTALRAELDRLTELSRSLPRRASAAPLPVPSQAAAVPAPSAPASPPAPAASPAPAPPTARAHTLGRIVTAAQLPVAPATPRRGLVAVVSLGAGLLFGLPAALLVRPRAAPVPNPAPSAGEARLMPLVRPRRRYWDDDDD